MNRIVLAGILTFILSVSLSTSVLADCGLDHDAVEGAEEGHDHETTAKNEEINAEIGCGHCTYQRDGVTKCEAAVKIGEDVYSLESSDISIKDDKLCTATMQAKLTGHVEDGKFIASKVEPVE